MKYLVGIFVGGTLAANYSQMAQLFASSWVWIKGTVSAYLPLVLQRMGVFVG